jgi:two-component system cell cycle response regulator
MHTDANPTILLASGSENLVSTITTALPDSGVRISIASSAQGALDAMCGPAAFSAVLVDAETPGLAVEQLLATIGSGGDDHRFPVLLVADNVRPEWLDRLAEGIIDDLLPRTLPPSHWRIRLDIVLRAFRQARELENLKESVALQWETDPLTGLPNRSSVLSMLFRETDRVQRMHTSLCLMVFEIDDLEHWHTRLGDSKAGELLLQVVARVRRLLRSYDLLGRVGNAEFVLGLPGCGAVNAISLAERIRMEIFAEPFQLRDQRIRLTAGFGIAPSHGRSPLIVLREAELALRSAQASGPEAIQYSETRTPSPESPAAFLSSGSDCFSW